MSTNHNNPNLDDSKTRRSAAQLARIGILFVAVLICGISAYRMGQLISNWRHPADAAALRRADATDLASLSPTLPLAGIWSFDELDWNMRSEWTAESELRAKFAALAATAPVLADNELPDADQDFLALAGALGIKSTERDGRRIYQLSRPGLQAQWITRDVNGKAKSCAFAVAYPSIDDEWQLFEFTPRSKDAVRAESQATHLLPLPAGARRDGGRFADDGRVLMEFVSLASTADTLMSDWNAAGWQVRESGMAEPGDFSCLAVRGEETVYAWSSDPAGALKNLMLVRTPAGADTGP
jgi:hypothetical protein